MNNGPVQLTVSDLELLKKSLQNYPYLPSNVPALFDAMNAFIAKPMCSPVVLNEIATELNALVITLCPEHRLLQGAQDANKRMLACHLMLMGAIFALNAAKACVLMSIIHKKDDDDTHQQISDLHGLCYSLNETCEYLYGDVIQANPALESLHKRYFDVWFNHSNSSFFDKITLAHLEQLIAKKNARQAECGGQYYGEMLYNLQSSSLVAFDDSVFNRFIEKCQRIQKGEQPRTQFVVYVHGRAGHVMTLDVSVNSITRQLQIICLESAIEFKQYQYLDKIIKHLDQLSIAFKILACQMDAQKDPSNCSFFAYIGGSIVASKSFEQLQSAFIAQPKFGSHFKGEQTLAPLRHTTWFKITLLGEKAVLLCQSSQSMSDNLSSMGKTAKEIGDTINNWKLWYGLDFPKQKTYIHHRIAMGQLKLKNAIIEPSVNDILRTLNAPDIFVAIRRLAAGQASKRLLTSLLKDCLNRKISLDNPTDSGNTAAHFSISYKQPKRALLLFNYGASFDKANGKGETARQLYLQSTDASLVENPRLKEKLKLA